MSADTEDFVFEQPASFAFTPPNLEEANRIIAKYPPGRQASAVLPLLYLAQRQHDNWVPTAVSDSGSQITPTALELLISLQKIVISRSEL